MSHKGSYFSKLNRVKTLCNQVFASYRVEVTVL